MVLIEYNINNCMPKRQHKAATITIYPNKGAINFSVQTQRNLGIIAGNSIVLMQDKNISSDWYIHVPKDKENGFVLKHNSSKKDTVGFSNKLLALTILKSCNHTDFEKSVKLNVGEPFHDEGLLLWPIITAPIVKKETNAL